MKRLPLLFGAVMLPAIPLFAAQIVVGENVQVSRAHPDGTHYEVLAAADLLDPSKLIVGSFLYPDDGIGGTVVYASTDGGKSWRPTLEGKALDYTGDPAVAYAPDGAAYYVASIIRPTGPRQMLLFRSKDGGANWGKPSVFTYTDRQYITVDATGGKYHGRVYVNGNNRIPKDVSDIVVFYSTDGGTTFHGPGKRPGFGKFTAADMGPGVVASDGTLLAVIAEGRGSLALSSIASTDGGESYAPSIRISDFVPGGNRKGAHNNANSLPMLAIDASAGPYKDRLYTVWPDRRSGHSEIWFASSADLGKTWSPARRINDNPPGDKTDQFMPNVAVNREGTVGVLWYDRREHPDNLGWDARFSASVDGGESFLTSVKVSEEGMQWGSGARWTAIRSSVTPGREGLTLNFTLNNFMFLGGDTAGLAADAGGAFHPVWVDNRTGIPQVWTAVVNVARVAPGLLTRISGKVTVEITSIRYDQSSHTLSASARLENTSAETLRGPFAIRATALHSELGELSVLNAENGLSGAGAEWRFPDAALGPGEKSQAHPLRFLASQLMPFEEGDRFRLGLLNLSVIVLGTAQ